MWLIYFSPWRGSPIKQFIVEKVQVCLALIASDSSRADSNLFSRHTSLSFVTAPRHSTQTNCCFLTSNERQIYPVDCSVFPYGYFPLHLISRQTLPARASSMQAAKRIDGIENCRQQIKVKRMFLHEDFLCKNALCLNNRPCAPLA